jgi:hypothetical protein
MPEKYWVKIVGVKPLLMHAPTGLGDRPKLRRGEHLDPKVEAESYLYKNEKGEIVIPSVNIKACIREAGRNYRVSGRKATFAAMIRASLDIKPFPYVPLIHPQTGLPYLATPDPEIDSKSGGLKVNPTWQVDIRPVVVQRNRILRARPRFDEWALEFGIVNNDPTIIHPDTLKKILEDAGKYYGLGDFRPEFGLFTVEKFEVVE